MRTRIAPRSVAFERSRGLIPHRAQPEQLLSLESYHTPIERLMLPVRRRLHAAPAGGLVLLACAAIAMVWANSPASHSYHVLWETPIAIRVGDWQAGLSLHAIVNDGLMAVFFFLVGLEIKREVLVGELASMRQAALPVAAALGGMIVPALLFLSFNAGGPTARGWGIPMATDIAFAMGVVTLLGDRVPSSVKVLLLTLAIVDDIGAIAVIAVFYTDDLRLNLLLVAAALTLLVWVMYFVDVQSSVLFVLAGVGVWLAIYESGVHATIAGVVLGLVTPARPSQSDLESQEILEVLENRAELAAEDVRATATLIRDSVSPCDRLIERIHPWTSYVVLPIFALANAGIPLSMDAVRDPSDVLLGVTVGLVVGKFVGVVLFTWLAVRLGLGRLPAETRWGHIFGLGAVAGIGFTVSLFISSLAFEPGQLQDDAKMGILIASAIAAALGTIVFAAVSRRNLLDDER
jgi:Na+:H+ antiporter, NhaA family